MNFVPTKNKKTKSIKKENLHCGSYHPPYKTLETESYMKRICFIPKKKQLSQKIVLQPKVSQITEWIL
jgi:hypothetical protein